MTQGQRLNLKWSVADTDLIQRLARAENMSDLQIVNKLKLLGHNATREEVCNIGWAPGLPVRIDKRPA